MREKRPTTEQTRDALDKIVGEVSYRLNKSDKYLYAILAGTESDPFAYFRPLFKAVCRVMLVRAKIWLDDLNAIYLAEEYRQRPATHSFRGVPTECRKECREAVDASMDGKSREVQIKEHHDCVEAHKARIAVLTDPDGQAEDESTFDGPRSLRASTTTR